MMPSSPQDRHEWKKVLIIAYLFPPIGGGGVQRALKMAKYLGDFGWQPHVLTVEPSYHVSFDETLLRQLPENVVIHRVKEWTLGRGLLAGRMGQAAATNRESAVTGPVSRGKSIFRVVKTVLKKIKNAVLIPDDQILWFPRAARAGREIVRKHGIDLVFSTSGPATNHLVGLYIKRTTGLPWIADFRDPWTQNMHRSGFRWREWVEDRLERMVHRESDALVTVTQSFADNFREKFREELGSKTVKVIHNGFDRADYEDLDRLAGHAGSGGEDAGDARDSDGGQNRTCTILYTGIFYKERNPRLFLRAVRELIDEGKIDRSRLRLRFAGVFDYPGYTDNADCVRELGLEDCVEVLGHLPHRAALLQMKKADLLLLVGDTAPGSGDYIPGKLYEYMAVGRPILALCLPGESARIIETRQLGIVAHPLDVSAIKDATLRLYRSVVQPGEDADLGIVANMEWNAAKAEQLQIYERRYQARMLGELMNELLGGSGSETLTDTAGV